jgi:hypothetical protein
MIKWIIINNIKKISRSPDLHKNFATNIFMGLMFIILLTNIFAIGLLIDIILKQNYPDRKPADIFNGFLFYYFNTELVFRLLFQKTPKLLSKSYLIPPIKRNTIAHYMTIKSTINWHNLFPLLIFIPFFIKTVIISYSFLSSFSWLIAIIFTTLFNSCLNTYLKIKHIDIVKLISIIILLLVVSLCLEYFDIFSFFSLSLIYFQGYIVQPYLLFLPVTALISIYFLNVRCLSSRIFFDDMSDRPIKRFIQSVQLISRINQI